MTACLRAIEGAIFSLQSYPIRDFATEKPDPPNDIYRPGPPAPSSGTNAKFLRGRVYIAGQLHFSSFRKGT
jgi:hypothetical protein